MKRVTKYQDLAYIQLHGRADAAALHSDLGLRVDKKTLLVLISRDDLSEIERWARSREIGLTISFSPTYRDSRWPNQEWEVGSGPTPGDPG